MELTEFLLARIAEDEAAARRWAAAMERDEVDARGVPAWVVMADGVVIPARVLAECEAKRQLVAIAIDQIRLGREARGWDNWEDMANQMLRALALPRADHPDYQPEWRP